MRMESPKDINYVSVECIYFLKTPIQIKGSLIMIYIQEHLFDSEKHIKRFDAPMDIICNT